MDRQCKGTWNHCCLLWSHSRKNILDLFYSCRRLSIQADLFVSHAIIFPFIWLSCERNSTSQVIHVHEKQIHDKDSALFFLLHPSYPAMLLLYKKSIERKHRCQPILPSITLSTCRQAVIQSPNMVSGLPFLCGSNQLFSVSGSP